MENEASAIARKIQNYLVLDNDPIEKEIKKSEPGMLRNMILVSLMGVAVALTQLTLVLLKWVKRLEG